LSPDTPGTPQPLEVTVEARDGDRPVSIVRAVGEIDMANAKELESALSQVPGDRGVVLNLTQVPFIDSSGLRVILVASQARGDDLAVAITPDSAVARIVEVAQVTEAIRRRDDEEAAVSAVAGAPPGG
jgi:anti-anti-sigma factor